MLILFAVQTYGELPADAKINESSVEVEFGDDDDVEFDFDEVNPALDPRIPHLHQFSTALHLFVYEHGERLLQVDDI